MDITTSQLESILFVASKPLALKKIAKVLNVSFDKALTSLAGLKEKYAGDSGVVLLQNDDEYQLTSNAANKEVAEGFIKAEISGELTRPQLETLTVISYCGPITKPELEQIRGVNCSLIVRNLLLRGLIKVSEDPSALLPTYSVTMDYLRHLGLESVTELPNYQTLHQHEFVTKTLEEMSNSPNF